MGTGRPRPTASWNARIRSQSCQASSTPSPRYTRPSSLIRQMPSNFFTHRRRSLAMRNGHPAGNRSTHATEAALHGTHAGTPVQPASRAHSNKDSVIGCHARRSVILEVRLSSCEQACRQTQSRTARGLRRVAKEPWGGEGQVFTEDGPSFARGGASRGTRWRRSVSSEQNIRHRKLYHRRLGPTIVICCVHRLLHEL